MIAVVDYGMGNLRSVQKALEHVGADAVLATDVETVSRAEKVVVPGVGAFKDAMAGLTQAGLVEVIKESVEAGKPFLGICLGLQVLFDESTEDGLCKGLGIVQGRVVKFGTTAPDGSKLKVPQIGWNQLFGKGDVPLLRGVADGSYVYFDHSYYVVPTDPEVTAGETEYGIRFTSIIWKENVFGTQFHPEKSQEVGLRMLKNFADL